MVLLCTLDLPLPACLWTTTTIRYIVYVIVAGFDFPLQKQNAQPTLCPGNG